MNAYLIYHLGGIVSERDSKLNEREIDEARSYLGFLANHSEPYCGLNRDNDGKGCNKTISNLYMEWVVKRNLEGKDLIRKKPLLVINEKTGYGLHRYKDGKLEYCGNINYYCNSCNKKDRREDSNVQVDAHAGYSNTKSRKVRPKFKEILEDHLIKFGDICEEGCVNKWSDTGMFDCAQKLLRESINQLMDHRILRVQKDEWGFECNYSLCNGWHLIHRETNNQPIPKMTDQQALDQELRSNEK